MKKINLKVATNKELVALKKLSTENLILWVVGKSRELGLKYSYEDIVIQCWLINPEKYSMRGYSQFPDALTLERIIRAMKGEDGFLNGSKMSGYSLTEISKPIYVKLKENIRLNNLVPVKSPSASDRSVTSIDEAPYKRLKKTPAYLKYKDGRLEEIVETDFLYFYGINWHSKKSFILNRIKNTNAVVKVFSKKDNILKEVHLFLNQNFENVKTHLLTK